MTMFLLVGKKVKCLWIAAFRKILLSGKIAFFEPLFFRCYRKLFLIFQTNWKLGKTILAWSICVVRAQKGSNSGVVIGRYYQ